MAFHDLSKRLILTVLSLAATFVLLVFSHSPFVIGLILLLLIGLTETAIWEYSQLVGLKRNKKVMMLVMQLGALVILGCFLAAESTRFTLGPLIILVGSGVLLFLTQFRQIEGAANVIAKAFFGLCYIAVPLGFLLLILYSKGAMRGGDGRVYLGYLIVVTKSADIGAYLGGRMWGKRKLAPTLSPKKTVEGAVIGLAMAVGISFCCYLISHFLPGFEITVRQSLLLGVLLGGFGQIGDLAESLLKREAGVKDSNRLPGLGGALDLIDSLLLTTPILYIFFSIA
ncbi:MAG: phosphatidate cytidylyltransferase [Chlamydiota bacterium]